MPEQINILKAIKTIVQEEGRSTRDELKADIVEFKNEILTNVDRVMREVTAARQEQTVIGHRINNHEERITTLEQRAV